MSGNDDSEFFQVVGKIDSISIKNVFLNEEGVQTVAMLVKLRGSGVRIYAVTKSKFNSLLKSTS